MSPFLHDDTPAFVLVQFLSSFFGRRRQSPNMPTSRKMKGRLSRLQPHNEASDVPRAVNQKVGAAEEAADSTFPDGKGGSTAQQQRQQQ